MQRDVFKSYLPFVSSLVFLLSPLTFAAAPPPAAPKPSRLTFDVGLSTGQAGPTSYTEANLGLNYYAQEWLAWRNAVFARFQTQTQNIYGLDSSLRLIGSVGDHQAGVTAFAGPGYRFANGIDSAPFTEEGLVFHAGGISVGGGAKQVFNSWIRSGVGNDNQYFLILAGGGSR